MEPSDPFGFAVVVSKAEFSECTFYGDAIGLVAEDCPAG
jgi:hypothetical protein